MKHKMLNPEDTLAFHAGRRIYVTADVPLMPEINPGPDFERVFALLEKATTIRGKLKIRERERQGQAVWYGVSRIDSDEILGWINAVALMHKCEA